MEAEYADVETNDSPYRVLKLTTGEDILCKLLTEYTDVIIVEMPLVVTKQRIYDKTNHLIEHTGLQKWMRFTNDVKFMISKEKLLSTAVLSEEVTLYYQMLANKMIEEQTNVAVEEDDILIQLRENMERLADIIGDNSTSIEDDYVDYEYESKDKKIIH